MVEKKPLAISATGVKSLYEGENVVDGIKWLADKVIAGDATDQQRLKFSQWTAKEIEQAMLASIRGGV